MKLEFEASLEYQNHARKSVIDLFEGQPKEDAAINNHIYQDNQQSLIVGVSNNLILTQEQILKNLNAVQKRNEIELSQELDGMNFSIEMETGTGKTYVYLRTIYDLNEQYGFKKFVIVVPSVAIREGVLKNLEITHDHFQNLYEKEPIHFQVYESKNVSSLKGFANGNTIEIMIMNIDAFAKDDNIINQPHYKTNGLKPVEYIKSTNPIVIVDEPQNMETDKRREAIDNLNPLCTLRYSATHRNRYNLIYSLNPVKAYDLGLVKQIEVDSVMEENADNAAYVAVTSITAAKRGVSAKVAIMANTDKGVKKKTVSVKTGSDLYKLSNNREIYKDGFIIEEIDAANECLTLSNGNVIYKGASQGGLNEEVMKFQMRKTIEEHLKKEKKHLNLKDENGDPEKIKVLSLFFIDKVANYRSYDVSGHAIKGKFAQWFEEIYKELISKPFFKELDRFEVSEIHNGYFASDKKGRWKDTADTARSKESADAADTYTLIMKDKERLLDNDNPLRFIFSHSALREGWDNPNVFQICTLNETKSDIKKRQEIGRGLRLAVNDRGVRNKDKNVNRLTVIANESYEDFAKALQKEIEDECGVSFSGRIKNKRQRTAIKYRKGFEADPKFLSLWEKIKQHTTYRVDYDTDKLIDKAAEALKDLPEIKAPSIRSIKVGIKMDSTGVDTMYASEGFQSYDRMNWPIPDVFEYIQDRTDLTRTTIAAILKKSGRMSEISVNPQLFLDLSTQAIRRTLYEVMINGIKYEKIAGSEYEMRRFEAQELEIYINDFTYSVTDNSRTIYEEYIPLDSKVESQFAADCETSENVQFYFKLPSWFKIPTPIGTYNPDWAVVLQNDTKVYFVAETKDTGTREVDLTKLHLDEQLKIKCGKAHFKELDNVSYKVVKTVGQLIR